MEISTKEQATTIAQAFVQDNWSSCSQTGLLLLTEQTLEREFGWVFFFSFSFSAAKLVEANELEAKLGHCLPTPFALTKQGDIVLFNPASLPKQLLNFEREWKEFVEATTKEDQPGEI